jgi:alpha-beta hydrolase superfamily lysophospholipase
VAQAALEVLVAYGKAAHKSEVSRGTALGYAVYALDGRAHPIEEGTKPCVDVVVDTSMEMLEQWNGHLTVACIAAIEKGKGKVVRKGRTVTFTLPEHWERF